MGFQDLMLFELKLLPTKNDIKDTIPSDPIIRDSISLKISCFNILHLVNFPNTLWSIIKYFPMFESILIPNQS